jgi:Holliday junction resolvase-like predicted endonuclease
MDLLEIEFRRLVDASTGSMPPDPANLLEQLCQHYGLVPSKPEAAREEITEFLYHRIGRALSSVQPGPSRQAPSLRRQLLMRHFAEQVELWPYLGVLDAVSFGCRRADTEFPEVRDCTEWREALSLACDVFSVQHSEYERMMVGRRNKREVASALAIARLRAAGYRVEIRSGRAHFETIEIAKVTQNIEQLVHRLGGFTTAIAIFDVLSSRFDDRQQRYHFPRVYDSHLREPRVPNAFLLNIAAKHINMESNLGQGEREAHMNALITLSRDFIATLDVEPYELLESTSNWGPQILDLLRDIPLYDSWFTLFQWRPRDVTPLLESLFDWLDDASAQEKLGWTRRDAVLVVRRILKLSRTRRGPTVFSSSELSWTMPGIPPPNFAAVIDSLATNSGEVNKDFQGPYAFQAISLWKKPLIRTDDDVVILDASCCAPAFFEAIRAAVQKQFSDTNPQIGKAFERMVIRKLREHGVNPIFGDYKTDEYIGECDIVVETIETIFLFELKKMGLVRQRAESALSVLLDLSRSLFVAQTQLAKQELALFKYGTLELQSNGTFHKLERRGRSIERIALTLLDFGGLQTRDALRQILDTAVEWHITTSDPSEIRQVNEINAEAKRLACLQEELHKIRPINGPTFFDCQFLNYGQLLVMLDDVSSNESLKDALRSTRYMSFATLDFCYEYSILRRSKGANQTT